MNDLILLIAAIAVNIAIAYWSRLLSRWAKLTYRSGRVVIETGVEPEGSSPFGKPIVDMPRSKLYGEMVVLTSYLLGFGAKFLIVGAVIIDLMFIIWMAN